MKLRWWDGEQISKIQKKSTWDFKMKEGQYKWVILLWYPTFWTYMVFISDDGDYCKSSGGLLCHFETEQWRQWKSENFNRFSAFGRSNMRFQGLICNLLCQQQRKVSFLANKTLKNRNIPYQNWVFSFSIQHFFHIDVLNLTYTVWVWAWGLP